MPMKFFSSDPKGSFALVLTGDFAFVLVVAMGIEHFHCLRELSELPCCQDNVGMPAMNANSLTTRSSPSSHDEFVICSFLDFVEKLLRAHSLKCHSGHWAIQDILENIGPTSSIDFLVVAECFGICFLKYHRPSCSPFPFCEISFTAFRHWHLVIYCHLCFFSIHHEFDGVHGSFTFKQFHIGEHFDDDIRSTHCNSYQRRQQETVSQETL
mmetsp:Transcript_50036/g.99429  ORF Transcript_50036/g.99429 Transcript_50036/m.99429 type:complete len:211 (-) Transcript_50036:354-986(-)